ncbi:MAG: carbohydrate ABC transporter permease, partial [Clostridia bacterium]
IVAGCSSILVCFIALFAGYALSRIKVKWNKWVIATLIFSQMFPVVSRLISLYSIMRTVHLLDTQLGLILAITAAQIPFSITLMASFFDGVPKSLEEAAYVDGAGRVRTLFQVVTPLVVPGLLAVGIYSFRCVANAFDWNKLKVFGRNVIRLVACKQYFCCWNIANGICVLLLPKVYG